MVKQIALLGTSIHNVTMEETLERIESFIAEGGFHQVATANTDFLVKALEDAELRSVLSGCDLVVADGMPLIWASRLMGLPLKQRVTGADLLPRLAELSARKGYRLFLLGATPEASRMAEQSLRTRYPGVQIVGRCSPPVTPLDEMDHGHILHAVHSCRPDILLVAFGNPKQEKWIARNRNWLQVPVCIGVGAAIDFVGGAVPRAPRWMQKSGLEWLHRLYIDPRRLAKRYLVDAVQFARFLLLQLWAHGILNEASTTGSLTRHDIGSQTVLKVKGAFSGKVVHLFEENARNVLREGQDLIVDLGAVSSIGPDTIGTLMDIQRLHRFELDRVRLAGLSPRYARALRLSQAYSKFHVESGVLEALARKQQPTSITQVDLRLKDDSAICRLAGELSPARAQVVVQLCRHLLFSLKDVRVDGALLSDASQKMLLQASTRDAAESSALVESAPFV
jgi:N-acetylglucosaminyldiphosphoundecaprenol N-acetyl-beta-D-mannosaminyltransferase